MNKKNEKLEVCFSPETMAKLCETTKIKKSYSVKMDSDKIKSMIADWVHHFKKDRWPLSVEGMRSDLFYQMFGVDSITFIATILKDNGIEVGLGVKDILGDVLFVQKPKKKPLTKKAKSTDQKGKKKK